MSKLSRIVFSITALLGLVIVKISYKLINVPFLGLPGLLFVVFAGLGFSITIVSVVFAVKSNFYIIQKPQGEEEIKKPVTPPQTKEAVHPAVEEKKEEIQQPPIIQEEKQPEQQPQKEEKEQPVIQEKQKPAPQPEQPKPKKVKKEKPAVKQPLKIKVRWLYVIDAFIGLIFTLIGYATINYPFLGLNGFLFVIFAGFGLGIAIASAALAVQEENEIFIRPPVQRKPQVQKVRKETITTFVKAHKRLDKMARQRSRLIAPRMLEAGMTESPYKFMSLYTVVFMASFVAVPVGIILAYFIAPYYVLIALAPAIAYFAPSLVISSNVGDRKRQIEDELPFFVAYASVMQSVGVNLYNAFVRIIGRGVFTHLEREAMLLKRNVEFFAKAPSEALSELGRIHPNQNLKSLLYGYTAQWLSGGDIAHYLELKANDLTAEMKYRWERYTNSASDLGEMLVSLFFVLPVLILTSAMVTSDAGMLSVVVIGLVPLLIVVGVMMISNAQPKTYDKLDSNLMYALIAGAVTFAILFFTAHNYLALAGGVIATTVVYGMPIFEQQREIRQIESALPQFMRDMTEYKKLGYDLVGAILKISSENTYNSVFDTYIKRVAARLKMGVALRDAIMKTRSWLTNTAFFLLAELAESGGGTPAVLENITNFIVNVNRVKSETRSSMRIYEFLAYFTPVGLAFVAGIMVDVLKAFGSGNFLGGSLGSSLGLGGGFALGQISPMTAVMVNYLIIMVAIGMAITSSKAIDFTIKSTIRVAIITIISVVSIILVGYFVNIIFSHFNFILLAFMH